MWKIGLTGSIATGKSTVLAAFAALGVPVLSSDAVVHELYRGTAVAPVAALFPGSDRGGVIDRAELNRQLRVAPEKLARLEALIHPMVRARIAAFLAAEAARGAPVAVIEIPLLYEGAHDYGLDRVVVTVADEALIRQRALARPGMSVDKLGTILARQVPQAEKRKRGDYVIDTSNSLGETEQAVAVLLAELRAHPKGK
jgi:dephospho-CoA kinase